MSLGRKIARHSIRYLTHLKPAPLRTLTDLANIYESDKGTAHFERHRYTVIYDRLFRDLKHNELTILEIGLRANQYYVGRLPKLSPSLKMWRDYFRNACVCGFDVQDFTFMNSDKIKVFVGDQGSVPDLQKMLSQVTSFDVVVDDGSHASFHQLVSLKTLWPAVKPGGYYIIEDLHYQPEDLERSLPAARLMRNLLREPTFLRELGLGSDGVSFHSSGKLAVLAKPSAEN